MRLIRGCVGVGLILLAHITQAATPAQTTITNNAVISYTVDATSGNSPNSSDVSITATATSLTTSNVPATLNIGTVQSGGQDGTLYASTCVGNSGTTVLPQPSFVSQSAVSLQSQVGLVNESIIQSGDPLFIKVVDVNQIKDPTVIEKLNVNITSAMGDRETIQLSETAPSSGVFIGYIQTVKSSVIVGDCKLSVGTNDKISVTYLDNNKPLTSTVSVDPTQNVFDSVSGALINGATITVIDAATNQPAKVLGDDGVSVYPSSIVSGSTVKDSGGNNYPYSTGQYRFPILKGSGSYKVTVSPPLNYAFPAQVADNTLESQFAGKFNFVPGASKGLVFNANNTYFDIPLDARSGKLVVTKTSNVTTASIGDFVQYLVSVQNTDKSSVNNVVFYDVLPKGFRLKDTSFYVGNQKVTPVVTQGTHLQYNLGTLAANQTVNIKYVTQISVGSSLGNVNNTASAQGTGSNSNIASATIFIKDDLMMDKAIITGTVFETNDCKKETLKRMSGVRIQFETGDYVVSDSDGLWHIDSLTPETHVAKLDKLYIPKGYEPVLCEDNNTFAGDPNSKFVEATPGSLTRVDFYLKRIAGASSETKELTVADLLANPKDENKDVNIRGMKTEKAGTEALSYNEKFMSTATGEPKFLFPDENFAPSVPAIGIAFEHETNKTVKMFLNEVEVSAFNFDGVRQNSDRTVSITYWRGVGIKEGDNHLEARLYDDKGTLVKTVKKDISFTNTLTQAIFVPSQSVLVSDGQAPIEVAVRFLDENGKPAHKGLTGSYDLEGAFTPYISRGDGVPLSMLDTVNKTQYVIGEDGIAKIKLMPSNQSGEATLRFHLKDKEAIVRPWISSSKREWILVGIAEGSLAQNKILNHTESDDKGMEVVEDKDGRIALYGKGTIKKDYLLTFSYDNKKQTQPDTPIGQTSGVLNQETYSVYGDSTIAQADAVSNKKLYIRIEKDTFYAMFGDFQTNLTVTDLTRYQRTMTGIKSEYKGDKVSYNAFAAKSATLLQAEEIPSDGTTGLYHSKLSIEASSETVTIVTRDRNQRDVIVNSKVLTRYVDYDIDYDLGTIRLKEPVATYDTYFNPIFIRLEYNSLDPRGEHLVAGGRVAVKVMKNAEVGLTTVSETGAGVKDEMSSVDFQYDDQKLKVKAETAISKNTDVEQSQVNHGYNVEAQYTDAFGDVKVYAKKVDENFGLTNSLPNDVGIQKQGLDATIQLPKDYKLTSQIISQKDLTNDSTAKLMDNKIEKQFSPNLDAYVGVKVEQNNNPTGEISNALASVNGVSNLPTPSVGQIGKETDVLYTVGGQYKFSSMPLSISAQAEVNPKASDIAPTRIRLGTEYDITQKIGIVADTQYDKYKETSLDINRIGLKTTPFENTKVQGYVGNATGASDNAFYQVGVDQSAKVALWTFDAGIARQAWDKPIDLTKVPAGTLMTYDNYNVYQLGSTYHNGPLIYQFRVEDRVGSDEHKVRVENELFRRLDGGMAVSLTQDYEQTKQGDLQSKDMELKAGFSYRDPKNVHTFLAQVEYNAGRNSDGGVDNDTKLVINTHYNYKPTYDWEGMAHVGYKYVMSTFDQDEYTGSSYVATAGLRYYFLSDYDIAVQGLYASTPSVGVSSKGASVAVGYRVMKNMWVSVGYQHMSNYDSNFNFDEDYVKGVFIKFRMKFDEESFHLNDKDSMFSKIVN